jgi:hypothetical protein
VLLLRKTLRPVASVDDRVKQRIAELSNVDFAVRTRATLDLKALGELARPALEELLTEKPDLEVRRRAERLLEEPLRPLSPEQLQALRALEVLERIGNSRARAVIESLANGAPGARQTEEAKAALERLSRRAIR